jgi:hypothetical protein
LTALVPATILALLFEDLSAAKEVSLRQEVCGLDVVPVSLRRRR